MTYTYTVGNSTITNGGGLTGNTGTITLSNTTGSTYTLASGAGSAGQIYTTTGINGATWANPTDNVMIVKQDPASLEVKGKLVHNGRDLEERLNTIEKILQIPERDVKLEKKHPKLKKLYDEYIHALGKYRTFEAIKGEDDGTT
jgi:hypothetical protein